MSERILSATSRYRKNIGDEAVYPGVDARRHGAIHTGAGRREIGEHADIGDPARIGVFVLLAPDALE